MICRFCGAPIEADDLLHQLHCDGRQGAVEATEPIAPYEPWENVRTSDPDTSKAAAESLDVTEVQRRVLTIHTAKRREGLTDEQLLGEYVGLHGVTAESSPRKRRCDLTKIGLIIDSGERRPLKSGRNGIVWRLAS